MNDFFWQPGPDPLNRPYVVVDNDGLNADLYDGDGREIHLVRKDETREEWMNRWVIGSIHTLHRVPECGSLVDGNDLDDKESLLEAMNAAAELRSERERVTTPAFVAAQEELRAFILQRDLHRRDEINEDDGADGLFFAVIKELPPAMDNHCVDHVTSSAIARRWSTRGDHMLTWYNARMIIGAVLEFRGRGSRDR